MRQQLQGVASQRLSVAKTLLRDALLVHIQSKEGKLFMRHFSLSRFGVILALGAALLISTASGAQAATSFFNGFETDTTGWTPASGDSITRVASGDTSTTYASGVTASTGSGSYYARLGKDTTPGSCVNGGGTQPVYSAPYTQWGGYESAFPTNGYSTSVDIYLDVPYATANADTRFDWSSAINKSDGTFLRDYVFNVSTDATGFVIAAGNNSTRCGADPATGNTPVHVTASGWYTFKHTFTNQGGALSVSLQVINKSTNAPIGSWVLSNSSDAIGTVGGHRYGWFVQNEFNGLAIDNSQLSNLAPTCTPTGFVRDGINLTAAQIGGTVTGTLDATGCNIGAYNPASVSGATIFGANYFGIVDNGLVTNVSTTTIHDIGEVPLNGTQHGVGIYYTGTTASGTISGDTVFKYQKNGITVTNGASATLQNNTVTGEGGISYIAQNGIQISNGATAKLVGNNVSLNNYTPAKVTACGLLIYKAAGVSASKNGISYVKNENSFQNNETDICNFGKGGGFDPSN
jgi:hypothetical protein